MRKTKPESTRDMWWAQQQMAGDINIEHIRYDGEPEEGAICSVDVSVCTYKNVDLINVSKGLWYYGHKEDGKVGWPLRNEEEWSKKMTFNEFRASEWWMPYLEKTKNINFDSSWMDSMRVEHDYGDDYAEISLRLPVYNRVWWCSSEIPTGNTVEYFVYVCSDGTMGIRRDNEQAVEQTMNEFIEAVRFANIARELGVSISDDGIITISRKERDAD